MRKRTFWHVRPTKTQISLRIRTVLSRSSMSAWRYLASLSIQNALSEDSDQTTRKRRLIWIFAGRTCPKVRFLTLRDICCGYNFIILSDLFWSSDFFQLLFFSKLNVNAQVQLASFLIIFFVCSCHLYCHLCFEKGINCKWKLRINVNYV